MKVKPFMLSVLLFTVVASHEASEEWAARQRVESANREMFSGNPVAWEARSVEASALINDRS